MEIQVKDVFCEMCNIGIGSSMTALSQIIGHDIGYTVPDVDGIENYDGMKHWYLKADEYVAGVSLPFDGDIEGMILIIYHVSMVREILEPVFDKPAGLKEISSEMLDMVRETGNLMASSYLSALSVYTMWHLNAGKSAVSMDMAGSMIGEAAGIVSSSDQNVFCIGSRFGLKELEKESCMLLMVKEHSMPEFIETLGGEQCAGL